MSVTSGSDSHGGNQANLGLPTMWVLAANRTEKAVLDALRAGRTTITRLPPALGPARLADRDREGHPGQHQRRSRSGHRHGRQHGARPRAVGAGAVDGCLRAERGDAHE